MTRLVVRQHGVRMGLALGGVRGGDGVDDRLGLLVADLCEVLCQVQASSSNLVAGRP